MKFKRAKRNIFFLFLMLVLFLLQRSLPAQTSSCIACHMEMEDELRQPVEDFEKDIHKQVGLSCEDCHGGNPNEEDMDLAKDKTFKGKPERDQNLELCASCHSNVTYMKGFNPSLRVDQLAIYWTSKHGQLLKRGDKKVAVCSDCHGVHGIRTSSHPKSWTFPWNIPKTCGRCHSDKEFMKRYKIPTSQEADYRGSVHAQALFEKKDLSAPVCNDCHGNHGAVPPEITSIAQVCSQCHPSAGDLFSESPHKKAYDDMGISECEACHGNHRILSPSDEMLGTGERAVCIQCHEEDSNAYRVAAQMKKKLQDLAEKIQKADALLSSAYNQGVEVSEPRYRLREAGTLLLMIRNLTHSFSLESIEEKIEEGEMVVSEVTVEGEAALREAKLRKKGLVIATFFVFILAIGIFLKIRQLGKKSHAS